MRKLPGVAVAGENSPASGLSGAVNGRFRTPDVSRDRSSHCGTGCRFSGVVWLSALRCQGVGLGHELEDELAVLAVQDPFGLVGSPGVQPALPAKDAAGQLLVLPVEGPVGLGQGRVLLPQGLVLLAEAGVVGQRDLQAS